MKLANRLVLPLIALVGVAAAAQDPSVFVSAPDLSFVLRGFTQTRSAKIEGSALTFSGSGNPVVAELNSRGTILQGKSIEGSAQRTGSSYVLQQATVTGGAQVSISSETREEWEIRAKRREAKSEEQTITRINSDRLAFVAGAGGGTISAPGALTIKSVTRGPFATEKDGARQTGRFEQTVDVSSAQATIQVDPDAKGAARQIRTGVFEGPVKITIVRNERVDGSETATATTYTATGDRMNVDFTGADKKISVTGNVKLSGTGADFLGTANAAEAVIYVDDDLRPIRYEFNGAPAETRIKTGGGK